MASAPKNSYGLPAGFKTYSPFPFSGMNVQASPLAIADQEFSYIENFLKLGDGFLRTAWDAGAPLYSSATQIVSFFFYTIGSQYYVAVFFINGTAVQVNATTGAVTTISSVPGTFYRAANNQLPACGQWGAQFLLIANRNTPNSYWAWDGAILYSAGSAAPNQASNPDILSGGSGYSSAPTVTPFGGTGSGTVVVANVQGGNVVELQITNPGSGYSPGDIVQLAFSGGGTDSSAILEAELNATGYVSGLTVNTPGGGYLTPPTVVFTGGGGTGAAATAVLAVGGVTSLTITNVGSGYTSPPTISFTGGGGSGATATATIASGGVGGSGIGSVNVIAEGSGYTGVPTVSFTGGGGTGAAATAVVVSNKVVAVNVTAAGSGYSSLPTVHFTGGGGTGAIADAEFAPTGVQSVTVVNGGTGFTTVPLTTFVGGGGAGATGIVVLSPTSVASINLTAGGSGYTSPTVTFIGGGAGSGATATAVIVGDAIGQIQVTDGGSGYTEALQVIITDPTGVGAGGTVVFAPTSIASVTVSSTGSGYTSPPAVEVSAGANNSAYATVSLMPFGVSGSCLETFNSRVWIGNPASAPFSLLPPGGNFQFSAAGGFTDFATPDGGGLFTNSDRFLQTQYVGMRQSNGYLYLFGDGSVSVVSNVQTSGTPSLTTFTYQNVDPQIGLSWRDSLQDFGRSVIFANTTGIYGLYGGNVTKISGKLDRLFVGAQFPASPTDFSVATPSGAVATLFDVKHYLCLMTITDPDTRAPRTVMATWNEKDWVVTSQSVGIVYIGTQKVSSKLFAWGTDGFSIYPLFNQPSSALTKRLDTKLYGADTPFLLKDLMSMHVVAQDFTATGTGVAATVTFNMSGPAQQEAGFNSAASGTYSSVTVGTMAFTAPQPSWPTWTSGTEGLPFNLLGVSLTTTSADFTLGNLVLGYVPVAFTN